jgi:uncharacterized membrane protein YeaQ/YmgE (transglycosylase-associated protein family)
MFFILALVVIPLVAGFIANFLIGRSRHYENWELFVVGIIGSFVGGLIFNLVSGHGFDIDISGLIGSTIGAVVVLAFYGPIRDMLRKRQAPPPPAVNTAIKPKNKNR